MGNLCLVDGLCRLCACVKQLRSEFSPSLLVAMECYVSGNGNRSSAMQISVLELMSAAGGVIQGRSASKLGLEMDLSFPTCNTRPSS